MCFSVCKLTDERKSLSSFWGKLTLRLKNRLLHKKVVCEKDGGKYEERQKSLFWKRKVLSSLGLTDIKVLENESWALDRFSH